MTTQTRKNIFSFVAGLVLTLGLYSVATPKPTEAQQLQRLQVAPARQELRVDPGDTAAVSIRFFNLSEFPVAGYIRMADFIVEGTDGTPQILENTDQVSPRFSAASWITLPFDRMAIAGNDKVEVQARIEVPADARPGGRYVAMYFEPDTSLATSINNVDEEADSEVAQRIAGLVYIRVNGPVTEKAIISRISAPSFLEYGPIDVEADILNRGDYHVRPQGSVTVKNMLGAQVDEERLEAINIFPDASRTYENELGRQWMFGKYTVEYTTAYGETGQVISRSIGVWVLPWKVVLVVLLALIILIYGGRTAYRRLIIKEHILESELKKEKEEIEHLKEELNKK